MGVPLGNNDVLYVCLSGDWIRGFFETPDAMNMTEEEKRILLARLVRATK